MGIRSICCRICRGRQDEAQPRYWQDVDAKDRRNLSRSRHLSTVPWGHLGKSIRNSSLRELRLVKNSPIRLFRKSVIQGNSLIRTYHCDMKRYVAELVGTGLIVFAVVGSGLMATNLTSDQGLRLLINCVSTVLALLISIFLFRDISGAHFNPIVSLIAALRKSISTFEALIYILFQVFGVLIAVAICNWSFGHPWLKISETDRSSSGAFVAEIIASAGLITIIFARWLKTSQDFRAILIATWIASAYFFTVSTSFANPAVSLGRVFTDSYAGISPSSFGLFVSAQLLGGLLALGFLRVMESER